jgi:flagellar biosynthesis GTPase FlhF
MFDRLVFFGKDFTNVEWEALKTFLADNKGAVLTISKDKMLLFVNSETIIVRKSIYETFFKHTELRKAATMVEETDEFYKFKLRSPDVVALYQASLIAYLLDAFTSARQDTAQTQQEEAQQTAQPKQQSEQQVKQPKQTIKKESKSSSQQENSKPDKAQKNSKAEKQVEDVGDKKGKQAKQQEEQTNKKFKKANESSKEAKGAEAKKSKPKKEKRAA